ncbi:hypothetical protein TWF281_003610 [Arthrobotrys megalospora]
MSAVDYSFLNPDGSEALAMLKSDITSTEKVFESMLGNDIVALTSGEQPKPMKGNSADADGLQGKILASQRAFYTAGMIAWKTLQDLNVFGQALVNALEDKNITAPKLYDILAKICKTWEKSSLDKTHDSESYEVGEKARFHLQEATTVLLNHEEDAVALNELMTDLLAQHNAPQPEGTPPAVPENPLAHVSLGVLFSWTMEKLLPSTFPHPSTPAMILPFLQNDQRILRQSFSQLMTSDPDGAARLADQTRSHVYNIHELYTQTEVIELKIAAVITAATTLAEILKKVPYNLTQFYRALPPSVGPDTDIDEASRTTLKISWEVVLDSIQDVLRSMEYKISPSEKMDVSEIAGSYTEVPRSDANNGNSDEEKKKELAAVHAALDPKQSDVGMVREVVGLVFGAPEMAANALGDFGNLCNEVGDKLARIEQLPLAKNIKVPSGSKLDISLLTLAKELVAEFDKIHKDTVGIIRSYDSYAVNQTVMLRVLNQPDQVTIDDLLENNNKYLRLFPTEAEIIAKGIFTLEASYKQALDSLKLRIADFQRETRDVTTTVENTDDQNWQEHKIKTVIERILADICVVSTAVSGTSAVGTEVAGILGIEAGQPIGATVRAAVEAEKHQMLLEGAKNLLAEAKQTYDGLIELVPLIGRFVNSVDEVVNTWKTLALSMDAAKTNLDKWKDPSLFTDKVTGPAIASWQKIDDTCRSLLAKHTGAHVEGQRLILNKDGKLTPILQADSKLASATLSQEYVGQALVKHLSAPTVELGKLRYEEIVSIASGWEDLSNALKATNLSAPAQQAIDLSGAIKGDILTEITKGLQMIYQYSKSGLNIPKHLYDAKNTKEWDKFWNIKADAMQKGTTQAINCDNILRGLQFKTENLNNDIVRLRNEAQVLMSEQDNKLRDLVKQMGLEVFQLDIIAVIIGAETDLKNQMRDQANVINSLQRTCDQLAHYATVSEQLVQSTASLGKFWNELTNDSNTVGSIWEVLKDYPDEEISIASKTWEGLEYQIYSFNPTLFPDFNNH